MIRKIQTKASIEKKQKRTQRLLGIILVFVMFGSVFGIIATSFNNEQEEEPDSYNGYLLTNQNGYYALTVGQKTFYFKNDPNNLFQIEYEENITRLLPQYANRVLYIDSEDYSSYRDLYQNLQGYPTRIQDACISEDDCIDEELPIKTCQDSIIIVKESTRNRIYENESCTFIEGNGENLSKLTDLFLLKILGIN